MTDLIGRRFVVRDDVAVAAEVGGRRGEVRDFERIDVDGSPAVIYTVRLDGELETRRLNDYEVRLLSGEPAGSGGGADESPGRPAQRVNRNVAGWRDRL